jgi:hypothetical protein
MSRHRHDSIRLRPVFWHSLSGISNIADDAGFRRNGVRKAKRGRIQFPNIQVGSGRKKGSDPFRLIIDDQIGGTGIRYDLSASTASSEVALDGGRITFDLPQPFERKLSIRVEISGGGLVATGKELFVDYWEKVNWVRCTVSESGVGPAVRRRGIAGSA